MSLSFLRPTGPDEDTFDLKAADAASHETTEARGAYAADAHYAGMAKARAWLIGQRSPGLAFLAMVELVEDEARIHGYGGHILPRGEGLRRLQAYRRQRDALRTYPEVDGR